VKTSIPDLRKKGNYSQEELASAVGVTRQAITSIGSGKYTASLPIAYKKTRHFGKMINDVWNPSQ